MNDVTPNISLSLPQDIAALPLKINEVFYSIQGESTRVGEPCVFIRLRGCHLRCHYCDTEYAFHEGGKQTVGSIVAHAQTLSTRHGQPCRLYEITGGEPLLQAHVHPLMTALCDRGYTVLIETSGACDISVCDPRVIRIMDLKTPGSGEVERTCWDNIAHLNDRDEVKFVICDRADYDWAKAVIAEHQLEQRVHAVLMSPAHEIQPGLEIRGGVGLAFRDLADWILTDGLPVRMQSQLHKQIWDPMARGV